MSTGGVEIGQDFDSHLAPFGGDISCSGDAIVNPLSQKRPGPFLHRGGMFEEPASIGQSRPGGKSDRRRSSRHSGIDRESARSAHGPVKAARIIEEIVAPVRVGIRARLEIWIQLGEGRRGRRWRLAVRKPERPKIDLDRTIAVTIDDPWVPIQIVDPRAFDLAIAGNCFSAPPLPGCLLGFEGVPLKPR